MLVILVGKSGCGKSTIEQRFEKMVSFTTRPPRTGEVHGRDYYFYPRQEVEAAIAQREAGNRTFIAQLSTYGGEYYGTSEEEVERIRTCPLVVAVMNLEGAKDMKALMNQYGIDAKIVWVDIDEALRLSRITSRMEETGESAAEIAERLQEDHRDAEKAEVDAVIDNNGTLEEAVETIQAFAAVTEKQPHT